jgi:hypothetical protein
MLCNIMLYYTALAACCVTSMHRCRTAPVLVSVLVVHIEEQPAAAVFVALVSVATVMVVTCYKLCTSCAMSYSSISRSFDSSAERNDL